jgi:hypothetical protein
MKLLRTRYAFFFAVLFAMVAQVAPAQDTFFHGRVAAFVSYYQDGDYRKASDSLLSILPLLAGSKDEIVAYRYIGFSYAMLNWVDKAKLTFKSALTKYPGMDIDTLEVPPNISIVFKQAKLERKLETLDTAAVHRPVVVVAARNIVAPTLLLSVSILSAVGSAGLFYTGNQQYLKYKSVNTPSQSELDKYYSNSQYAVIGGVACAAVTGVLLPVSIYLYNKKVPASRLKAAVVNGAPGIAWQY